MKHYVESFPVYMPKLIKEVDALSFSDKIVAVSEEQDGVAVHLNTALSTSEITELEQLITYHDSTPESPLRVFDFIGLDQDPLKTDFSIIGLVKVAPHYDRGRKLKSSYQDPSTSEVVVDKTFVDIRDQTTSRLISLQATFNWYRKDGTIGLTKTEIVKNLNKSQAETEERKRRERAIDFLISEARDTSNEPYIDMIMDSYSTQIANFKAKGSYDFSNAIELETDANMLAILSSRVPLVSDNSYTVPIKESIMYNIGTLDEAGLFASLAPA